MDHDGLLEYVFGDEAQAHVKDAKRSSVFEERLASSSDFVEKGNEMFKAGKTAEAKQFYIEAGFHADFDAGQQWDMTPEHKQLIRSAQIRVLLNLANTGNKLAEFELTKKACTLGLKLALKEPKDASKDCVAKFHYRRAKAMLETGCLKEAVSDAKLSLEILPNDAALRQVYSRASEGLKKVSTDLWKGKSNLFDFPPVDLTLTDKDGNPIPSTHAHDGEENESAQSHASLWDLLCCKRKKKLA